MRPDVASAAFVVAFAVGAIAGCRGAKDTAPSAAPASAAPVKTAPAPPKDNWPASERPELIPAELSATGDLGALLTSEMARATADGRKLIVYVGATWCEPCRRFHDALKAGSLHAAFPKVRFLELDADRHARPLQVAGCQSDFIPLFALPDVSGRCSPTARIAGSVKGDGAVANIVPRLQSLLAGKPVP
jgi:hypothetical protein